jgi:hypothetical protein
MGYFQSKFMDRMKDERNIRNRSGLVIALLRPRTPKHIRGGWPHCTDTSEPVDGNLAQNMVIVQSGSNQRPLDYWPTSLPIALTGHPIVVDPDQYALNNVFLPVLDFYGRRGGLENSIPVNALIGPCVYDVKVEEQERLKTILHLRCG